MRLQDGLRRIAQASVLALLVLIPASQIWTVGATTRWSPDELEARYGPLARPLVETSAGVFGDPPDLGGSLTGGTWSIGLEGFELADPIAVASLLGGLAWPPLSLLLGGALVLLLHVLFGRLFCGWLCPYGTLSRLVSRLRPRFALPGSLPRWLGYLSLGAVVLAPLVGGSLVSFLPYAAVGLALQGLAFGGWLGATLLLGLLLLSDLLLWEHGVCRSLCPSGALQSLVGRWRVLRLEPLRKVGCQAHCHLCAEACWLGLDPRAGAPGSECDSCGRCIGVCPSSRLVLRLPGQPTAGQPTAGQAMPGKAQ